MITISLCKFYPISTKETTKYINDKYCYRLAGSQFSIHPQSGPRSDQNPNSVHLVDHQQTFSISFSGTFKAPTQFPFPQDGGSRLHELRSNNLVVEHDIHTRSSSLSSTLGPGCALSLLSSSLHHRSPATGPAQVTSALAGFAAVSQDPTSAAVGYASGVAHHTFAPDALLEDPSQALPFFWQ
jgi:hypothetical protein